jgi:proteasome lid subunit RPN8/RPN11
MLTVPPRLAAQMQDHAFNWYPNECCGLLFARQDGDEATRVVAMDNLQGRYHFRLGPPDFPRQPRTAFKLDERRMARLADEAAAQGERLLAVFHSHIDCAPEFSLEDSDMAAPPPARVPVHPDLWHVVLEIRPDGCRGARAYRWDGRGFAGSDLPDFAWSRES